MVNFHLLLWPKPPNRQENKALKTQWHRRLPSRVKAPKLEQDAKSAADLEAVGFSVAEQGETEAVNVDAIHSGSDIAAPKSKVSPGRQGLEKAMEQETAIASESSATLEEQGAKSAADLEAVGFSVAEQGQAVNVDAIHSSSDIAAPKSKVSPGRQGLEKAMEQTAIASESSATLEEQGAKSAADLEAVGFSVAEQGETEAVNVDAIHSSSDIAAPKSKVSPGRQGLEKAMEQQTAIASESSATLEEQDAKSAADLEAVGFSVAEQGETEAVNVDAIHSSSDIAAPKSKVSPGRQGLDKALEQEQALASSNPNTTVDSQPRGVESSLKNVDFTVAQEAESKALNQDAIGVESAVQTVRTQESPGQQGLKEALEQPNSIEQNNEVGSKVGKDALDALTEV